jgi:hypothetical protein
MNGRFLITALILGNFTFIPCVPVQAQNPPAQTYQPGFWQPVARIDINRPLEVKLINKTDLILEYDLTNNQTEETPELAAGNTASITGLKLPAYILIDPSTSNPNSSRIKLQYQVSVDSNNTVNVGIVRAEEDMMGNRTLNLHETGAIYIY